MTEGSEEHGRKEPFEDDAGFAPELIEGSIVRRFEDIVRRFPGRIAVRDRGEQWTYEALNGFANQIAHTILTRPGAGEDPIPLVLDHTAAAVAAIVGVLKAGKAYCALDPLHPQARLRQILEELQGNLIITDAANADLVLELVQNPQQMVLLDSIDDKTPAENPAVSFSAPLAAICCTSGSTGHPKGVEHSQPSILHRIWLETNSNRISANDRVALLFSLSFSASIPDLFCALLNGASLCLYDMKTEGLDALADWLEREQVTLFHIPIAAVRQFLDSLPGPARFPAIRHFVPSGRIYRTDLARFWDCFPNATLLSHMGASETSLVARMVVTRETKFSGDVLPVGYPVSGQQIFILDETGAPLPREHVGEIAVCGHYLSSGYWRRPDLTAEAFLPDPEGGDRRLYRMGDFGRISADGCLEYLGRRDAQIKIHGYRVELGEVEAALHRQEGIREAVVVTRDDPIGEKKLAAYIVLRPGSRSTTTDEIRSALRTALPDYMVPASFVLVPELPRTRNGKVIVSQLPEPGHARPSMATPYVAPRNQMEMEIAALWADLLEIDQVGIHDEFLELGGHSLLAMQLVSRILRRYGLRLSPQLLFETATVATQAAAIAGTLPAASSGPQAGALMDGMLDRLERLSDDEVEKLLNGPIEKLGE